MKREKSDLDQDLKNQLTAVSQNLHEAAQSLSSLSSKKPRNLNDLGNIYMFFMNNLNDGKLTDCLIQIEQINRWLATAEKDPIYNQGHAITNAPLIRNLKNSIENQVITEALSHKNKPQ